MRRRKLLCSTTFSVLCLLVLGQGVYGDDPPPKGFSIAWNAGSPKKIVDPATKAKVLDCRGTWQGLNGAVRGDIENITVAIIVPVTLPGGIKGTIEVASVNVPGANIISTDGGKTKGTWMVTIPEVSFEGGVPPGTFVRAFIKPGRLPAQLADRPYP